MFGTSAVTSGLTFGKVVGGISKTLGIVNQVIPIYQQAKPMISNARNMYSIFKEFRNGNTVNTKVTNNSNNYIIEEKKEPSVGPTFFQ